MKLVCVGDVALGDDTLSAQRWPSLLGPKPDDETRILLNWELPMGDSIDPVPRCRGPRLLAFQGAAHVIERWSPGFATLATNHILDARVEGLVHTIDLLNETGFATVGAGRNREEIERPLFWETTEGRLAIVNWVFPETHPDWMSIPGPHCWPGLEAAKHTIQDLKQKTDWTFIVVHWSDEHFSYPRPEDRVMARELAHMGADFIVGHHPHVVRGMELIDSCPAFYSIGNFYFADIADGRGGWVSRGAPRNREGLGVQISFRRGKRPDFQLLSFWNTKRQVILDPIDRARRRMEQVSRPLRQFRNSEYSAWYAVERTRFDQWEAKWHFGVLRLGLGGTLRRLCHKSVSHLHNPFQN